MRKRGVVASLTVLLVGSGAVASEVSVIVADVGAAAGVIRVAACHEADFLKPRCFRSGTAPARVGRVEVGLADVPPGTYALQAFHDVNGNGEIDTDFFGKPREGIGFSNDAVMRYGPPEFAEAAVAIGPGGATVRIRMRYFD